MSISLQSFSCSASLQLSTLRHKHVGHSQQSRAPLRINASARPTTAKEVPRIDSKLDDKLSMRPLTLDDAGYFIIKIDRAQNEIVAEYFTNIINKNG